MDKHQCNDVRGSCGHSSDCAVNNAPSMEPVPCDCGEEHIHTREQKAKEFLVHDQDMPKWARDYLGDLIKPVKP